MHVAALGIVILLSLFAALLALPLLVILLVTSSTKPATVAALRFLGWLAAAGCLAVVCGWFVRHQPDDAGGTAPFGVSEAQALERVALVSKVEGLLPDGTPPAGTAQSSGARHSGALAAGDVITEIGPLATDRPAWVEQPAALERTTYRAPVKSGLYVTQAECQAGLNAAIAAAVDHYLVTYLGDEQAVDLVRLDSEYLRAHLIKQPLYAETVQASVGPMQQLHALLEFDDEVRAELHRLWREAHVSHRLRYAAAVFGGLLALLGIAFGYLKADLATHGAYTPRLRWGAALAILLGIAGTVGFCVL